LSEAPTLAAAARARPSHALAAVALALLLGLQPMTTDLYLPALPLLTRELAAPMALAQLTMSALLLAFGLAQLVWGPVADRVGRRPVLLAGLALYTLASVGAALAGTILALVAWRVLQGLCLAASVVVARAMLRDLYEPVEGAQVMALALSGLGVIAVLSPALGGIATTWGGWRAPLAVVAAGGAAALFFIAWRVPETLAERNPRATAPGPLLANWRAIAANRQFVAWTALISASYGGLFTFLAGSSFVYIGMVGLSPVAYGAAMATGSFAYLAGTLVCRRWIPRLGLAGSVRRAAAVSVAAGVLVVAGAAAGWLSAWAILLPQWLFCFAHGIHQPCGQAGAVGPFPRAAGAAAALAGFAMALVAFVIGLFLGAVLKSAVLPFALCVGFWSLATAATALTLVQRLPGR
jgi:DHA1 family bicyclomycin/chloramphenicol resistance-like MFS transporter